MFFDPTTKPEVKAEPIGKWRQILLDAATIIEARGHAKGVLEDFRGRVCVLGAMNVAETGDAFGLGSCEPWRLLVNHLGENSIPHWNNAPERTAGEVVETLRAAAAAKS